MSKNTFQFTEENLLKAQSHLQKYPEQRKKSAILALLDLAQRQLGGWLEQDSIEYVAELLKVSPIRVYEVASFYTMFNLKPIGKNLIQMCRTTPCWLRGSDKIAEAIEEELKIKVGETTEDKQFTFIEVECLAACVNAPIVQINDDYYEDLDENSIKQILKDISSGKKPKSGSQIGRQCSAPVKKVK
jgi:NADH-quinone oxidoreductase E subunit